ncbi:MAG: hypothetical protein ABSF77_06805 [Spirochaetia bacterium]|jgi:hypothetical protein
MERITSTIARRLSHGAPTLPPHKKLLRVGIFAVAADPLHWMHLLTGLKAIAHFNLDKVVYVISGNDPRKPNLLRADIRHCIGEGTLRLYASSAGNAQPAAFGPPIDFVAIA